MNKEIRYISIGFLFFLLILVRAYSTKLFYDPLVSYFIDEYMYISPEGIEKGKLFLHMLFRFLLNTIISLAIIWLVFRKISFVKFSGLFYLISFVVLSIVFFYLLENKFSNGYLLPFYIRRFIIHPLILLILLPAFYYQILQEKEV